MSPAIKIDVPQKAPFLQATLEHTHIRAKVTPNEDASLAYEVLVPKPWAYGSKFGPVGSGPLTERGIGVFAGGAEPGAPVIAVTVMQSPFEIPIDAWARANLAHDGWETVSASWFPGAVGLYFDITATRVVDDKPEVRRTSVRARGNDIFSVNCMCALEHWESMKETFWAAHATFELATPNKNTMEPWLESSSTKEPAFATAHPASWLSEPVAGAPENVSAIDVRLVDAEANQLLGYVQVKAERLPKDAPKPSIETRTNDAIMHLARTGITADPKSLVPLTEQSDPRSVAAEGWIGGFDLLGQAGGEPIALRLGFLDRKGLIFTFTVLSPLAKDDLLISLRTQRTFEITRAKLTC